MSNVQSYNALIDRFKAFAAGHFILKRFSHGQIEVSDLEKFGEYPFMHVIPSNVTYSQGMKTFSFQIVLADLPRDKEDKSEYQREALSDLQRIAEDLIAEITNHRVLFGDLITVQNVSLEPFLEEFQHTLTGWTVSLDLLVPYYWDACSIPAEWNDFFESSTGGTGSILTFIDSITRDENGNVSLVNDEAEPSPNYYYGTNDEGVRGWYLLTDEVGLTCVTLPTCQTIIDIEAAIDDLQEEILLKANTADLGAVAFSNDYNDLDNKPTIPDVSGFVPYTGATTDVDLGTHNLTADHIALNVSPSGAGYVVGATEWNNTIGSSQTLLKGGNVSLKNGVDLVARIVNKVTPNTTLTKAAYQAVRISGAQGGRLAVALAQANNDTNSADTIGIVTETIATNQEGFILTVGQLENINTTGSLQGETWADGDVLYLSPTTAGALTNIKPTGATGHIVVVGYVEYAHANNGSIYVKVMNGWELDELHNVAITSPTDNQALVYESVSSLWKNETVDKTFVGLGNVDNTSDANKPISTATQTALNAKQDTLVSGTNIKTINGASVLGSGDLVVGGSTTLAVGTTPITSGTVGRVLFEGTGNVLQESANFFWDNTNSRLGIGTATPASTLDVTGTARVSSSLTALSSATIGGTTLLGTAIFQVNGTNKLVNYNSSYLSGSFYTYQAFGGWDAYGADSAAGTILAIGGYRASQWVGITFHSNGSERMRVATGGNVLIGTTTDAGFKLDVNGTARVSGQLSLSSATPAIQLGGDLTISNTPYPSRSIVIDILNSNINLLAGGFGEGMFIGGRLTSSRTATTYVTPNGLNAVGSSLITPYDNNGNVSIQASNNGNRSIVLKGLGGSGAVLIGNITTGNGTGYSAILQADSTTQGFLPPRMTTTQKNAIATPAAGLVVYDTTLGKLCVRGASAWETITSV